MLLIGQPKSGSTALLYTIAEIAGLQPINGKNWTKQDVECEGWTETQKYHHTTVKRSKDYIEAHARNRRTLYKEHILPTPEHIEILRGIKDPFVVLLREPEEVFDCYDRINKVLDVGFDFPKLYDEIVDFYDKYLMLQIRKMLIVTYKSIVMNFHNTMEQVLEHYGLDVPVDLHRKKLLKKNYTGVGLRRLNDKIIC
jgi:hypothetical protein